VPDELVNALFSYDSAASHTNPHLRDAIWRRENAVLTLGTTRSLAQLIFTRPCLVEYHGTPRAAGR
jgi:hypothetical protein